MTTLLSHKENVHDSLTGVKGSFVKTFKAIKNLINKNIPVEINIIITSKNYEHLVDIVKFIKINFPEATLALSFVRPEGNALKNKWIIPKLTAIKSHLIETLNFCEKNKMNFTITDCGTIPLCFIQGFEKRSVQTQTKNDLIDRLNSMGFVDFKQTSEKVKSPLCESCGANNLCVGVWKNYAKIYGLDELTPIYEKVDNNGKKR